MYDKNKASIFLKNVYFRENTPLDMAVKRAYRDFNRTISFENICHKNTKGYEDIRKELVEKVVGLFAKQIETANQDAVDNWHKSQFLKTEDINLHIKRFLSLAPLFKGEHIRTQNNKVYKMNYSVVII